MKTTTLLFLLTIAQLKTAYSQISKDTSICITHHQAKTINLIVNRLQYMESKDSINQDYLKLKDNRIQVLNERIELRESALIGANTKLMELERQNKKQKFKIICYKIALIGSAVLYLYLSI